MTYWVIRQNDPWSRRIFLFALLQKNARKVFDSSTHASRACSGAPNEKTADGVFSFGAPARSRTSNSGLEVRSYIRLTTGAKRGHKKPHSDSCLPNEPTVSNPRSSVGKTLPYPSANRAYCEGSTYRYTPVTYFCSSVARAEKTPWILSSDERLNADDAGTGEEPMVPPCETMVNAHTFHTMTPANTTSETPIKMSQSRAGSCCVPPRSRLKNVAMELGIFMACLLRSSSPEATRR